MKKLQAALKFFAEITDTQNVPVGIVVTTSGKFAVKYSLSEGVVIENTLQGAARFIINEYMWTIADTSE